MYDISAVQMVIYERNTFLEGGMCTFRLYIQLTTPTKWKQVQGVFFFREIEMDFKPNEAFMNIRIFKNKTWFKILCFKLYDYLQHVKVWEAPRTAHAVAIAMSAPSAFRDGSC